MHKQSTPGPVVDVMATLRGENGCPCGITNKTTVRSRRTLIEEAYEVLDAIDSQDDENLVEELGDVLLPGGVSTPRSPRKRAASDRRRRSQPSRGKLIDRHPHVFGDAARPGRATVLANWDRMKRAEKAEARGGKHRRSSPTRTAFPKGSLALMPRPGGAKAGRQGRF